MSMTNLDEPPRGSGENFMLSSLAYAYKERSCPNSERIYLPQKYLYTEIVRQWLTFI